MRSKQFIQTTFIQENSESQSGYRLKSSPKLIAESRQRLLSSGEAALSAGELLSLLLNGQGDDLWQIYQSLTDISQAPWQELVTLPGIGAATACRLKAAVELGRRLIQEERGFRPQITSPADAANLLLPEMRDLAQEHLRALLLDTKNRVIETVTIYIGTVNRSLIRVCEVIRPAIRVNASALILAHNHPSGDPTPSPEDVQVSRCIFKAGQLLGIEVLDHLIIGHNRYVSLKEEKLAFGDETGTSNQW